MNLLTQFKTFLTDVEVEYGNVKFYKLHFFYLRKEIFNFKEIKVKSIIEFFDKKQVVGLGFLTDLTAELNLLNTRLHRRNKLICNMSLDVELFEMKINYILSISMKENSIIFPITKRQQKKLALIFFWQNTKMENALKPFQTGFESLFADFNRISNRTEEIFEIRYSGY